MEAVMAATKKIEETDAAEVVEESAPVKARVLPSAMGSTFAERAKANGFRKRVEAAEKK